MRRVLPLWTLAVLLLIGGIPARMQETATPIPPVITVRVWLPDRAIMPGSAAAGVLTDQIAAFEADYPTIRVEVRPRSISVEPGVPDAGGLLYGLRTAAIVAPGALPDLVLLRRADLVAAFGFGVLVPLDGFGLPTVDLPAAALALRDVDGQTVGLPYLLDIEHLAYNTAAPGSAAGVDLETFLELGQSFIFPAGRPAVLPDWFLTQYADAIAPIAADGEAEIDPDGLRALFRFYERAAAADLIHPGTLTDDQAADYAAALADGAIPIGVLPASLYLAARADGATFTYGALPTLSGSPTTLLDGWLWAITARDAERDPARQAALSSLLAWLYEPERQFLLASSVPLLPASRAALRLWEDDAYAAFALQMIEGGVLAPDTGSPQQRAISAGLLSVLRGERSAAQAVRDVLAAD